MNLKLRLRELAERADATAETAGGDAPALFSALLHAVTQAHMLHLRSQSFSEHKALGELYSGLSDKTDDLIEAWQGLNGLAEYPASQFIPAPAALPFVEGLRAEVAANRVAVGSESELQNLVDEIQELLESTAYKLKFLK